MIMMKICTAPECSYTFLHLTLQEYMVVLHIAIKQPDSLESLHIILSTVAIRFFAGICHHAVLRTCYRVMLPSA